MKKVCLISINSLSEQTGGGHYLRCLVDAYLNIGCQVTVLCKASDLGHEYGDRVKEICFNKNIFSDLFSRILGCPSFLLPYFFKVLKCIKENDIVAFHSSRLGSFAFLLKSFVFEKKEIIFHFDNVESALIKQFKSGLSLMCLFRLIDRLLVPVSEKIAIKVCSISTFITQNDYSYFQERLKGKKAYILPICFEDIKIKDIYKDRKNRTIVKNILFTGSFDFEPNVCALYDLIEKAKNFPKFDFFVAGRKLEAFRKKIGTYDNVFLFSDLSKEEMAELFQRSDLYFSPVSKGSGMKTKIAEALRSGLPVICEAHSSIGYEEAIKEGVVFNYRKENIHEFHGAFQKALFLKNLDLQNRAREVYLKYYSGTASSNILEQILAN